MIRKMQDYQNMKQQESLMKKAKPKQRKRFQSILNEQKKILENL